MLFAANGNLPDLHRMARLSRLPLGQTDGSDLWLAVGGIGNTRAFQHRHLLARDFADRNDALHGSGMSQLRHARDDVPNRIDTRFVRLHIGPHVHETALEFHARLFEPQVFSFGRRARRR